LTLVCITTDRLPQCTDVGASTAKDQPKLCAHKSNSGSVGHLLCASVKLHKSNSGLSGHPLCASITLVKNTQEVGSI